MNNTVNTADIQGNILLGYRKSNVRHIVLEISDAVKARAWLQTIVGDDRTLAPRVTDAAHWGESPPPVCFNVAFTHSGLLALGVSADTANSFPESFRQGMAARAKTLGDWDESSPAHWHPWFRPDAPIHLVISLHANSIGLINEFEQQLMTGGAGAALRKCGHNDGAAFNGSEVHFGYRDNLSQPRFTGFTAPEKFDGQPAAPLGTVLLGHTTAFEQLTWEMPTPVELGMNGTFNAYRILEQDASAFEAYLDAAAQSLIDNPAAEPLLPHGMETKFGPAYSRFDAFREVVAAKIVGRWRNGTPLALSAHDPYPDPGVSLTDFDYSGDEQGLKCPFGSHTRRANPRSGKIVQKVANHTRRLVRRGMPYGPAYDPSSPDTTERGLLGNFLCANLAAQFEAVQYDWINLGLQDPRITGSNDPLLGANDESASWFDIPVKNGSIRLHGFPRFIQTRGGAYTFIPTLTALSWLGRL